MLASIRKFGRLPNLLQKIDTIDSAFTRHGFEYGKVLNVGSKTIRLSDNCTNLDIAPGPKVDIVADAHDLATLFQPATFDTVVLSAVLQYCREPRVVVQQAAEVLKPNGVIAIDAPFLQPYCPDGADLWRFTADGLRELCREHFNVVEISVAIPSGSALAFAAQAASRGQNNTIANKVRVFGVTWLALPITLFKSRQFQSAGALIYIGRKVSASSS